MYVMLSTSSLVIILASIIVGEMSSFPILELNSFLRANPSLLAQRLEPIFARLPS